MHVASRLIYMCIDTVQIFIMKDAWRDDERRVEGEFYQRIGPIPGVAAMHSYGVVYVEGEADTVASRARRDLSVHAKPRIINGETTQAHSSPQEDTDGDS